MTMENATSGMRRDRLGILREIMSDLARAEAVNKSAANWFDMESWYDNNHMIVDGSIYQSREDGKEKTGIEHWCGTAACALGYAALDPRLNAQGLKPTYINYDYTGEERYKLYNSTEEVFREIKLMSEYIPRDVTCAAEGNSGERLESFFAAMEFFGLTYNQATSLFSPRQVKGWLNMPLTSSLRPAHIVKLIDMTLSGEIV